jgi:molecular chaperone IbpA
MNALNRFDANALNRALIGFDTMFDQLERRFANQIQNNYPPHNIIRTGENTYAIEVAVAGFAKNEVSVTIENNELSIKGEKVDTVVDENIQYLHRGLASRDFVRVFPLAEHIEVKGAEIKDGILTVKLERIVPEELKPRVIDVVEVK